MLNPCEVIFVESRILGEVIAVVLGSWEGPATDLRGKVAYSPLEIQRMRGRTPDELRELHAVKSVFGGGLAELGPDGKWAHL